MNRVHALRYLLLKHLWNLRGHVAQARHEEIANSLAIQDDKTHWLITWRDGNQQRDYRMPRNDVTFYRRGDLFNPKDTRPRGLDRQNEEVAGRFVRHLFDLPEDVSVLEASGMFPYMWQEIAGHAALLAVMTAAAPASFRPLIGFLLLMLLLDYRLRIGRMLLSGCGLLMAMAAPPLTALVTNALLALFQFLDPDPKGRGRRTAGHVAAATIAAVLLARGSGAAHLTWWIVPGAAIALATFAMRWVRGPQFRFYPLVFPLICVAMMVESAVAAGAIGLAGAALGVTGLPDRLRLRF